ncbi:PulJ/GspJ family protein [Rugamonas rivuli]|uniref:Prepilin-type N-terminal cleavage/methylation domain-containing protein n=1 Tax=Rugamonas rivuli TaxID=2743358 RepID=A0A843SGI0_9BURK|nr:prepilin-type N-terminal cleavage/methylation domain-containing protein [Rugamonas rivuli]MQA22332.1 prepilin-type N-terminal cleavage/methylation domain-containing protein [Rugamonas rivuli]
MTRRLHRLRRARGFTLIELLVAISILAIVAVLGWRGLDGIIRSRGALTAQMEQTRGLQLAFAQLQSDSANLAPQTLIGTRALLRAEDNRITLVRLVLAENDATRLQVVSYRVRDGVLTRRESAGTRDLAQLDALWEAANSDIDPAASVALQSGVQRMAMRFWTTQGWVQAAGVMQAPAAAGVPSGLEVSMVLDGQEVPMTKSFLLGAL